MSLVKSVSPDQYRISRDELQAVAAANDITIPSDDEYGHYLWLLNSIDVLLKQTQDLPFYEEPKLKPQGERKYWKPTEADNPINAWSHRTELKYDHVTDGPLKGLTVCIKDNTSVGGLPITCGTYSSLLAAGEYPLSRIDATIVSRLLEAGATITGIATCENFSMAPQSYTSASGVVHNPWIKGYMCGGSTSGGAALVGINTIRKLRKRQGLPDSEDDGLGEGADFAIGGDQGGSIRIPCSLTGIYGLKPTHGLVPYTGLATLLPLVDHAGPMGKSIPDVAMMLSVIAGYDGLDPRMTPETPLRENVKDYKKLLSNWIEAKKNEGEWTSDKAGAGFRIGVLTESLDFEHVQPQMRDIIRKAAGRFADVGAVVEDVSIPLHKLAGSIWTAATRPQMADYALKNQQPPMLTVPIPNLAVNPPSQNLYDLMTKSNPAVINALFSTTFIQKYYDASALTAKAYQHVWQLRAAYDAALEHYDVLLLPTTHVVGAKHPTANDIKSLLEPTIGLTSNTAPFNVTGHPGLVVPAAMGMVPEGKLPVGMQLIGKRWDEETLFKVGMAWEVAGLGLEWTQKPN